MAAFFLAVQMSHGNPPPPDPLFDQDVNVLFEDAYAAVCKGDEKVADAKIEQMLAKSAAWRLTERYHIDTATRQASLCLALC